MQTILHLLEVISNAKLIILSVTLLILVILFKKELAQKYLSATSKGVAEDKDTYYHLLAGIIIPVAVLLLLEITTIKWLVALIIGVAAAFTKELVDYLSYGKADIKGDSLTTVYGVLVSIGIYLLIFGM